MSNSYSSLHIHAVWSTKNRAPLITQELNPRLLAYMGGIARENNFSAPEIGGVADHVHLLMRIPAALSVSHAVQLIKGGSSKWVRETFPEHRNFRWQEGFGAFSVSPSQISRVRKYIAGQEAHHAKRTFQDELRALLKNHGIDFDEKYLWG